MKYETTVRCAVCGDIFGVIVHPEHPENPDYPDDSNKENMFSESFMAMFSHTIQPERLKHGEESPCPEDDRWYIPSWIKETVEKSEPLTMEEQTILREAERKFDELKRG